MGFKDPERKKEYSREYHQSIKEKANERSKLWYKNNVERRMEYRAKYKRESLNRLLLSDAKTRAKRLGLDFDLKAEDIVIPTHCPILGMVLESGTGGTLPQSPSVDKINPKLGYVKGNVQVISYKANRIKNNGSPEELRMFAKWVLKTFPEEPDGKK